LTNINYFVIIPYRVNFVKHIKNPNINQKKKKMKKERLDLKPERSLYLSRSFSEKEADNLIGQLFELNKSEGPIFLFFNSHGGSFPGARKLYDNISLSPNPVIGIVIGDAFSAAAMVLQACETRYASEGSRILIHHVFLPVQDMILHHDDTAESVWKGLEKDLGKIKKNDKVFIKAMSKKMIVPQEEIIKLMDKDQAISAKKALKFGLIDEIINIF